MSALEVVPTRAGIDALQSVMADMPQIELDTKHYFADGMYCRELRIPAGVTLVGKVHKKEHFCILSSGELLIVGEGYRQHFKAPCIFPSQAGAKRAGHAMTDTVFITVHRTDLTDLDLLEQDLIEADPTALFDSSNKLLGAL